MKNKFYFSSTLHNRLGNVEEDNREQTIDISLPSILHSVTIAQKIDDPILLAIQDAIPSACLIVIYESFPGENTKTWVGSGFLLKPGLIVTAAHLFPEATNSLIKVSFDGINKMTGNIVINDQENDVGVLSISEEIDIKPLNFFTGEPIIGEEIATVGSPEGWDNIVTVGRISATHKTPYILPESSWKDMIFIDAHIFEGSSGSMVINIKAEILGMVMGIIGKQAVDKSIGQNAVIPINRILEIVQGKGIEIV